MKKITLLYSPAVKRGKFVFMGDPSVGGLLGSGIWGGAEGEVSDVEGCWVTDCWVNGLVSIFGNRSWL